MRKKPPVELDTVIFHQTSRDASKDFKIERHHAEGLFKAGKIAMDATNGGYCFGSKPFPQIRDYKVL